MKRIISITLSIAIFVSFNFLGVEQAYAATPSDYVSCWDFEEASGVRYDANTTNSNDLTDNNTVTSSSTGKVGTAAEFTAANTEYLSITDATQVGLDPGSTYTWAFWYKIKSLNNGFPITKYASGAQSYGLQVSMSGGADFFRIYNSSETTSDYSYNPINQGQWYYYVVTYNSGTATVYIDGTQVGSPTGIGTLSNTSADFRIGSLQKYAGNEINGLMDVVEIYDRVLSGTEITALYNSGNGVGCTGRSASFVPSTPKAVINSGKMQISGGTQI